MCLLLLLTDFLHNHIVGKDVVNPPRTMQCSRPHFEDDDQSKNVLTFLWAWGRGDPPAS